MALQRFGVLANVARTTYTCDANGNQTRQLVSGGGRVGRTLGRWADVGGRASGH